MKDANARSRPSVEQVLARLRARQRRMLILRMAGSGLFFGSVLALLIALAGAGMGAAWIKPVAWPALLAIPAIGLVGALAGLLKRLDALSLARALDRAAGSHDRLASALQLASHPRRQRVQLATEDALVHVSGTSPKTALPWKTPRELKWLPLPLLALLLVCWLFPSQTLQAREKLDSEMSAQEWARVQDEFRHDLSKLEKPESRQEQEIRSELEKLLSAFAQEPDKKDLLAQISKLQSQLGQHQQQLPTRDISMRKAASSMSGRKPMDKLAELLRSGAYGNAAKELQSLAENLASRQLNMTAAQFESVAEDFERLSNELSKHEELSQSCRNCASAASSMNRDKLADALKNFSQSVQKNADNMRKCDSCRSANSLLDQLRRRLSNSNKSCSNCKKSGCNGCNSLVQRPGAGKAGPKAGWGSAKKWDSGTLGKQQEQRMPDIVEPREGSGTDQSFSTVSPEEHAQSAHEYKELYAEMVRKAEADLALEDVPLSYRDYLRRYFNAIRPQEEASEATPPEE